jgi:hypothetical protein
VPRRRPTSDPVLVPLLGASLLTLLAALSLPWREAGAWSPRTPIDRSTSRSLRPGYELLLRAEALVPPGATYVIRTEPPDARLQTFYRRLAISLLPGRREDPPPASSRAPASRLGDPEFLVLVGPPPKEPPGELLHQDASGTVWRRLGS